MVFTVALGTALMLAASQSTDVFEHNPIAMHDNIVDEYGLLPQAPRLVTRAERRRRGAPNQLDTRYKAPEPDHDAHLAKAEAKRARKSERLRREAERKAQRPHSNRRKRENP